MKNLPETNAPSKVTRHHIGQRILYRLPNQAVVSEGEIMEISPEGNFFKAGRSWLANESGAVLSVLSGSIKIKKRKTPYDQ
ncbi:hypothetical protein [Cerasicoccus frondis]|uniref:hypothetical protein n=1 Tax=Cerasicoccus frondis TaxID=490090 RepID=UPI0028526908|nr:hypothetical protein [Cerasicoccus frondis]